LKPRPKPKKPLAWRLQRLSLQSCRRKRWPPEPLVEEAIAQPVVAEAVAGQTPEAVTDEPQVAAVDDTLSDETRGEEPALSDEELEALALASQPLDDEAVEEAG
jgi:fused signal recognition particle receptor